MSLFSKFTKNDKAQAYPWSQRKLGGSHSHVLPRFGHAASVVLPSDNLILFGGAHNKSKKDLFLIDTNTMSASPINAGGDVPTPRMYPAMAPLGNNCVLLYGGEPSAQDEKWDPHFYTLNLGTRQWTRIQMIDGRLPVERSGHSVAVGGNSLYFWGGQRAGRYLDDMFVLNAATYQSNPQWEHIASTNEGPAGRSGHASVVYDNKLYIFGGSDGDHLYNDVWAYDLHSRSWSQISAVGYIPGPREGCAAALVNDVMYVFGGRGPDGRELGDLCAFKIRGQRWFTFQNMGPSPCARSNATLTAVGERVVAIGGDCGLKPDDLPNGINILDCSKIRYPPEAQAAPSPAPSHESDTIRVTQKPSNEILQQRQHSPASPAREPVENTPTTPIPTPNTTASPTSPTAAMSPPGGSSRHRSLHPEQLSTAPQRPPRHMSMVPPAALRRPRATSPLPADDHQRQLSPSRDEERSVSPTPQRHPSPQRNPSPQRPPRPSREGVSLGNGARTKDSSTLRTKDSTTARKDTVSMFPDSHIAATAVANTAAFEMPTAEDESELESLMREIKAQDAIIHSMKKKEPWWRGEVSLARKMRSQDSSSDDAVESNNALFAQLMALKAELKRAQAQIGGATMHQSMNAKVQQTDRIRTAALQEAAYFKSKYIGLMERRRQQGEELDDPVQELEHRLAETLTGNETNRRLLQQLNKQGQYDHGARESAEDRAKEAQQRATEATMAHERALEKLEQVHRRAAQAEAQVRENVNKVADLTNQLADCLSTPPSQQMEQSKAQIAQLEQANAKVLEEAQVFKQQLAGCMEDIQHLQLALDEREEALGEAMRQLEDTADQVSMMKHSVSQRSPAAATSTTRAY